MEECCGNGNCLFNYVSICLTEDESKAKVLHKVTATEIFIHCDDVDNRLDNTCEVIRQDTVQVTLYQ